MIWEKVKSFVPTFSKKNKRISLVGNKIILRTVKGNKCKTVKKTFKTREQAVAKFLKIVDRKSLKEK